VNSFPKQPLDEWIIDYPQQTILSTIHLILTHEINEMLHDMRLARGTEGPSMTQSEVTETFGMNDTSLINTRSNHQLQDVSKITENIDSQLPIEESKAESEIDTENFEGEENSEEEGENENIEEEGKIKEGKHSLIIIIQKKVK